LVADRILTPPHGVEFLGSVPDRPFDQKQMLMTQYVQHVQAESAVLQHHRQAFIGTQDYRTEQIMHGDNSDDHAGVMNRMIASHYGK
jgi:hypothetical protein